MQRSGHSTLRFFLSYRREDAPAHAGRLADYLVSRFGPGSVFMDVDSIVAGADFSGEISEAISGADAVLVVMGPGWTDARDAAGARRLDDLDDFVRAEVDAALRAPTRVIPILVGGASMPSADQLPEPISRLARLNAHELWDRHWRADVEALAALLENRVMACPRCDKENPLDAAYCGSCAAPLHESAAVPSEERKTVSILVCDLVGPSSGTGPADPEDLRASLSSYGERVAQEIESHGGTVLRRVGDHLVAVFGAPVTHEDDAERAVRAGLRIRELIDEMNDDDPGPKASVTIGIDTGEALVSLGPRPEADEDMVTGAVVNTAARIQTGAPVAGVAVGESTYLVTKDLFEYEELEPITTRGKEEPVKAWRATSALGRFGTDLVRDHATPLVGRDLERTLLRGLFDRAVRDATCQLVTLVGEPGVGKSRMVSELFSYIDNERPELITWRQGRCLPYGDGITFWALGEIVKAHAGILESDSVGKAGGKLDRVLRATGSIADADIEWLRTRLAPLVGAESTGLAEQDESFAAWRRFLEAIAMGDPIVYVFEDLHWADPAMLAFIEHLADWSEGIPMLVVATARPELSAQHPSWGAGLRNATTMSLAPLTEEDTARLIGELLGRTMFPAEVLAPLLERAGGNPLYAEEFVRMLKDRGLLAQRGSAWSLAGNHQIPFPENVQGLISARLDTLPPQHKALLQDAAVVGKVFWAGALAAMGSRTETQVREFLHELNRKELVRAERRSTMEGEDEFVFRHLLVRDVAYGQIPRAARAAKHVAAAEWIEAKAGERSEDLADVLAHHLLEAVQLTEAMGIDASELITRALRFLVLAGDRAFGLDAGGAESTYEQALGLAPPGHLARPEILLKLATVLRSANRFSRGIEVLEEAIGSFMEADQPTRASEAKLLAASIKRSMGPTSDDVGVLDKVIAELEAFPPGIELVRAYADRARFAYTRGDDVEAAEWADRALALSDRLGLSPDPAALRVRGATRCFLGDLGGVSELKEGISQAQEQGLVREAAYGYNELSNVLLVTEGPASALAELEVGATLARERGHPIVAMDIDSVTRQELLYDLGRWDELVAEASGFLDPARDVDAQARICCRILLCAVAAARGDLGRADGVADGLKEAVLQQGEIQYILSGFDALALLSLARGDRSRALTLLHELEHNPKARGSWNYAGYLPELVRISIAAGDVSLATDLADGPPDQLFERTRVSRSMAEAELAEACGELTRAADLYAEAEEGWQTFSVLERAQALLGRGRCLLQFGDPGAGATLRQAREAFASFGAKLYMSDVDALLERAARLSS